MSMSQGKSSLYLTSEHRCERTCPIGFYPKRDRSVAGECETCPEECAECSSASVCSVCKDGGALRALRGSRFEALRGLFLTPTGWCMEGCPVGYYAKQGSSGVAWRLVGLLSTTGGRHLPHVSGKLSSLQQRRGA